MKTRNWRIAADTGGTFTDVMGWRGGALPERVKVLSSGRLRVRILCVDEKGLRVDLSMNLPDGFFRAYRILSGQGEEESMNILDSSGGRLVLELSPLGVQWLQKNQTVEITADEESPVMGARILTGSRLDEDLPVEEFRLATTKGTNALLEEKGVPVVFFVTSGLADLLRIKDQKRPDIFALFPRREDPIHARVVEVGARMNAQGGISIPLSEETLREQCRQLRAEGFTVAAVALLHSYCNSEHEEALGKILRDEGFAQVSLSSRLTPRIKILPRAETALVDAYLTPVLEAYLKNVHCACTGARLRVMDSAGELAAVESFRAKDSLMSGPAGGVMGVAAMGQSIGVDKILSFDMGGTSTDVARVEEWPDRIGQIRIGRATVMGDSLRIETVAAGGGSICGYRHGQLFVGPKSAGAQPGPACYGAGGPLTLTDVNLLLGRIPHDGFSLPLQPEASRQRLSEVLNDIQRDEGKAPDEDELLSGFLLLANQRMADAIHGISVREGYDPSEHSLLAFGGAGGQHACAVADLLGMERILSPSDAGLLSAYGLHRAKVGRTLECEILRPLKEVRTGVEKRFAQLEQSVRDELWKEGFDDGAIHLRSHDVFLRFAGQETSYSIPFIKPETLEEDFCKHYQQLFGYTPDREIEVVRLRVIGHAGADENDREEFVIVDQPLPFGEKLKTFPGQVSEEEVDGKSVFSKRQEVMLYRRDQLFPGSQIPGPALISDPYSCLLIEPDWIAQVGSRQTLRLERTRPSTVSTLGGSDRIRRELFAHRLTHIAEEMGEQLRRTALSTNIKERLDFSCAILDAEGRLITNAPHIPVHLGALGECVRRAVEHLNPSAGDVIVTNHPAYGGSHLPDVTLITPVYDAKGSTLYGYVANRAHHAELGGILPGSMPPLARNLEEEGVVIPPMFLYEKGVDRRDQWMDCLRTARYPSRSPEENMADLDAQVAANLLGVTAYQNLCEEAGWSEAVVYLQSIYDRSASALRNLSKMYSGKVFQAREILDGGSHLQVKFTFDGEGMEVDFTGSSPVTENNPNATPAIVRSALMYVLRLLSDEPIPLNEGLLDSVRIVLPEGSLLSPRFPEHPAECPPVVAGNVELSQRLVDTLLKPFERVACSQGTMNNLVFGPRDKPGYYETICGGAGAGEDYQGASAIHTHMTNTAITDPEILERLYPVVLEKFALRQHSGGEGLYRGGEGVVRILRFLEPMQVSILSQHRKEGPYGMNGGTAGKPGAQFLYKADGSSRKLAHDEQFDVEAQDRVRIETPGGGGFGDR